MTKEMVFAVSPNGTTQGLHFDDFDLSYLGNKEITRASEIMFNETTQLWDIYLPQVAEVVDSCVCGFAGYDIARRFEVDWLQGCMKEGCAPESSKGVGIARILRASCS